MKRHNKEEHALYMISVAARLAGVHPQTLRIYERKKLISPERSPGSTRLYSDRDIKRLKAIKEFTRQLGVNLAGVRFIFDLQDEMHCLKEEIEAMEKELEKVRVEMEQDIERVRKSFRRELMLLPKGNLMEK